jgi:hypothetical protein
MSKFEVSIYVKGPVTRNTHIKYEIPITYQSKNIDNVKFLKSRSNFKVKFRRSKIMEPIELLS